MLASVTVRSSHNRHQSRPRYLLALGLAATVIRLRKRWWTDRVYFLAFSLSGPVQPLTARSTNAPIQLRSDARRNPAGRCS